MHLENLQIFCDLVDSESFSKAAKLHEVTQSAVSQQLRSIEKHFNVLIVDRHNKKFRLTNEGEKLYAAAKDMLDRYEELVGELQELQQVVSGSIHVSTIYSIGLHELHPYVKEFMQQYPSVNVRIEFRRSNLVYEDVLNHDADIGLVAYPISNRLLEVIPFTEDQLVLICSPENPLSQCQEISITELSKQAMIGFDKDIPTRKATDVILRRAGLEIQPVMEFDNVETVKRAVEINAGVALIPEKTVEQEVRQGQLVKVKIVDENLSRPLAILVRKGRALSPSIKRFIQMLTKKEFDEIDQITSSP